MYKQNNSEQMKTAVETFIMEEVESLIYDNDKLGEWNQMVESLGLRGQQKIVVSEKSPIPFLNMNLSLVNVFETLCPRRCAVEDFDVTPIPVEILGMVALAKREQYFQKIEVLWDDKNPDPAVIGSTGHWSEIDFYTDSKKSLKGMEFTTEQGVRDAGGMHPWFRVAGTYLIGKWGDVKHSFSELKQMARTRFLAQESVELNRKIKDAKRRLDDLEDTAFTRFGV